MTKPSGAASVMLVFALAVAGVGTGLDLMFTDVRAFWIGADPGMRGVLGVGVGVTVLAAARVVRWALARRADAKEARGASDHA